MSGHSKWASIKRAKGATDAKRGVVFSKLARLITLAAKNGVDLTMNFQLRIAVDRARAENMPKDNIDRAIEKAAGGADGSLFEELLLEAYGPGGTAFLIEAATDNRNRTLSEVRSVLNKHQSKLAETGSVQYLFDKKGLIHARAGDIEALELAAIDAGATDIEVLGDEVLIYTPLSALDAICQQLTKRAGVVIEEYNLCWEPKMTIAVTDSHQVEQLEKLAAALDDLDDVTRVASNSKALITNAFR